MFPSWRRHFWRCWTFGAVLVALVLLLQGIYHCSEAFSFSVIFIFFSYVHPYCHYGTALLQRVGVIGIISILIYILFIEKIATIPEFIYEYMMYVMLN
jgi:hypothetical protein